TAEEAIADKRARVVEEVKIDKDVDFRDETIRDTVRRTRVDVDRIGDFSTYDSRFRTHFKNRFSGTDYDYKRYEPAYRYGYNIAYDERYYDRRWEDIEPQVRTRWEEHNQGTWEEFKDAVRHGWNEVKQALT